MKLLFLVILINSFPVYAEIESETMSATQKASLARRVVEQSINNPNLESNLIDLSEFNLLDQSEVGENNNPSYKFALGINKIAGEGILNFNTFTSSLERNGIEYSLHCGKFITEKVNLSKINDSNDNRVKHRVSLDHCILKNKKTNETKSVHFKAEEIYFNPAQSETPLEATHFATDRTSIADKKDFVSEECNSCNERATKKSPSSIAE